MTKTQQKKRSALKKGQKNSMRVVQNNPHVVPTMGVGGSIPIGFPDKIIAKLRYHDAETLTSTGGTIQKYTYRWNSTFDPDLTGTGHQPMFRDTFAGIYDNYSVISAVAHVKFINVSGVPMYGGCITDDDSTLTSSLDAICEQTHGWHELIPALTGSLSAVSTVQTWNCNKFLGIDPYTSASYKTPVGSNPTNDSTFTVWSLASDGSTSALLVDVEFEYVVMWSELQTPSLS